MKFTKLSMEGLMLINLDVYNDQRGLFFELYNKSEFLKNGIDVSYLQDNVSVSKKNVIRGLHFQVEPFAQGKLIHVLRGAVLDVVVDIRSDSPTYGKHELIELNEKNRHSLWIPSGFAHGFAVLEDQTCFLYKCSNLYNKSCERGIRYNDPDLNIPWGIPNPLLSEKDMQLMSFLEYNETIKN